MGTLTEIEAAAEALSPEQKQELFLFLATRLCVTGGPLPAPREFSREQIADWIADDEKVCGGSGRVGEVVPRRERAAKSLKT